MIRITKGDITIECETQADVRLALGVFADVDVPALPEVVNAPAWRVGGPRAWKPDPLPPLGVGLLGEAMVPDIPYIPYDMIKASEEKPKLVAVDPLPQHITVSRRNREILEAVMLFPEGVSTGSLATLLGLKQVVVAGRVQALKAALLVEKVPGHRLWQATTLARRSKLVTG